MATTGSILKERKVNLQGKQVAMAKQKAERVVQKAASGNIHAVNRKSHKTLKQEAVDTKTVVRTPKRRYMQPSHLPGMPELPGYVLQYIRRDNRNRGDCANLSAELRSGWEICRKSDFAEEHLPAVHLTAYGDCIGNDDTILCKIAEDMWAERQAMVDDKRDSITNVINRKTPSLDVSHQHMPLYTPDIKNEHSVSMPNVRLRTGVSVASD